MQEIKHFEPQQEESAQGVGKQNQTPGWFLLTWPKSHIYHKEFKVDKVTAAWLTDTLQLTQAVVRKWKESKDITFISDIKQEVCMTR